MRASFEAIIRELVNDGTIANNNELTSFPIMANESFTFDHNPKRGIEFEFKPRQKSRSSIIE
jgi:hypothetical protein